MAKKILENHNCDYCMVALLRVKWRKTEYLLNGSEGFITFEKESYGPWPWFEIIMDMREALPKVVADLTDMMPRFSKKLLPPKDEALPCQIRIIINGKLEPVTEWTDALLHLKY